MKKRVKSLLLGVAAIVGFGAFATACIDSTSEHTHTYAETWEKDAEGHWNALTCECTDVTPEKKAHVDKNNDSLCDICEYDYDHTHTYAEDWTVDCTNHWHAADCGHLVAGDALAAHVDENEDGECDVCGYVIEDIHVHYYASEWTSDEEYHWHAALCEHKDQVADKEAHVLNVAGDCTVCGAHVKDVDMADVGAVLAAAQANNYKVAFGDVIASEAVYGGTGAQTLENGKTNKVHFALGKGQSYIQYVSFDMYGNYIGQDEQWYEELPNGDVFGVQMEAGEYELEPISGAAQFLNGYNYTPGSVIPSATDDTSTLANMLVALYNQMKAGIRVSEAVEGFDEETGYFAFAYTYYSENVTTSGGVFDNIELELYNVAVTFSVNEEMIIDEANFYVEVYRDYEADSDLDYTYEIGEDGATVTITSEITLKPTANPTYYTYSVSQAAGERTFTTPYPRAALIPSSFEFLYVLETAWADPEAYTGEYVVASETIDEVLEIQEGTYAKFAIGDILPKTASSKFLRTEDFTFSFVNNDPESSARAWYESDSILNGYSAYSQMLKLKLRDVGEYTVTIGFGGLTKTFTLKIVGEPEPEIPEDDANTINVATTDTYAWVDEYSYTAAEEGTYTFTVPAGLGVWEKSSCDNFSGNPEIDYNDTPNGGTFDVDLEAGQTFKFYVGATTKGTWVISVSFVAGEVEGGGNEGGEEGGDEGGESGAITLANIVGTYTSGSNVLVINADGTMTWTAGGRDYNYTITIDGNTVSYSLNGNPAYTAPGGMSQYFGYINFDADGKPVSFVHNATTYELTAAAEGGDEGEDGEAIALEIGENNVTVTDADRAEGAISATFEVVDAGTYTFASSSLMVRIYDEDDNMIGTGSAYLEAGSYKIAIITEYTSNAGDYSITVEYSAPEGDDDVNEPDGYLYADEYNDVEVTDAIYDAGYAIYSFTPSENGNYSFTSGDLMVASITDADGNELTSVAFATYELEVYTEYFVTINTSWVSGAGTYQMYVEYQAPEGHYNNPIALTLDTEITVNYKGDYNYTHFVYYATENGTLTLTATDVNADMSIAMKGASDVYSEDGVVSLDVIEGCEYIIGVGYDGEYGVEVDVVFTAEFVAGEITLDGSEILPFALELGVNTAMYIDYETVYYIYSATEDGVLTLTAGENTNMWVKSPEYLEPVDGVITVEVYAGDKIFVCIETADWSEGEVSVTAALKAAPTAAQETLNVGENAITIAENTYLTADVYNLSGDYIVTWDNDNLIVMVDGVEMENGGTFNSMSPYWGVYFMIYTDGYVAATANFTITAVVVPATPVVVGDNTVTVTDTNNGTPVEFTATEAGDYTITAGTNVVINYQGMYYMPGDVITATLEADAKVGFTVYTEDRTEADVVVTIAKAEEGGTDEPAQPDGTESNPYIVTELPYSITLTDKLDVYVQYTATEDCTLVITRTGGNVNGLPGNFENDLTAKTHTGTVTAGQVLLINFYAYSSKTYTIEVATPVEPEPEPEPDVPGDEYPTNHTGSGTQNDRYVILSLPYGITFDAKHDVYMKYTATEDCTLYITCPAGCYVSELGASKDGNGNYTVTLTAGQTLNLNPWNQGGTAPYTYTITKLEVEEPEEPEQGGDVEGSAVTYLSAKHSNGRVMKVEIDTAAGTMTVTRSDATGNFTGGATSHTATFTPGGDLPTSVSGVYITWDADGAPVTVSWMGANYEGFTLQA